MSDFEQQQPGRRGIDRIIRSRGETPTYGQEEGANDAQRYEAFLTTEGFPQMGFSVFCTNGQRHGFFYHNLDSIDLTEGMALTGRRSHLLSTSVLSNAFPR